MNELDQLLDRVKIIENYLHRVDSMNQELAKEKHILLKKHDNWYKIVSSLEVTGIFLVAIILLFK